MRIVFYLLVFSITIGLATWAYRVNYATRAVSKRVENLNSQIKEANGTLDLLKAEWAYLNRPNRLLKLADQHFSYLELVPLSSKQIFDLEDISNLKPLKGASSLGR